MLAFFFGNCGLDPCSTGTAGPGARSFEPDI